VAKFLAKSNLFQFFQSTKSASADFFNTCFVFRSAKAQLDATFLQKRRFR